MKIPKLQRSNRSREYNTYETDVRDKIIYSYLFEGKSRRKLDEECIKINPDYSKGWQSMGVLHYLGMKNEFKGLFTELTIESAIDELKKLKDSSYNQIIESLERYKAIEDKSTEGKNDDYIVSNKEIEKESKDTILRNVNSETIASYSLDNKESGDEESLVFDLSEGIRCRKERTERHNNIVKKFAVRLEAEGFNIFEGRIDCLGIKESNIAVIGEIKTLDGSKKDEYNQVMKAFAQLYYYEEFSMCEYRNLKSYKIAIFESKIDDKHIDFLEKNNIYVIWIDKNQFVQARRNDSKNIV